MDYIKAQIDIIKNISNWKGYQDKDDLYMSDSTVCIKIPNNEVYLNLGKVQAGEDMRRAFIKADKSISLKKGYMLESPAGNEIYVQLKDEESGKVIWVNLKYLKKYKGREYLTAVNKQYVQITDDKGDIVAVIAGVEDIKS